MIEKLARAFSKLRGEVSALSQRIDSLPEPKDGRDGVSPKAEDIAALVLEQIPTPKDGVSPKAEDIAALVLEQIPTPKDGRNGKDADACAIIEQVLAQIPKPKDGKDAQPPLLADVAEIVMARMPKPKDGKDGRSPTAQEVAAVMPAPKPGPKGRDGKDGVSVTDVKLERGNILSVWLDGKKKRAGKIDLPPAQPPQFVGGGSGGRPRSQNVELVELGTFGTTAVQSPTGLGDAGKIRVNFGTGGDTDNGEFTVAPNGLITCNKNSIQYDFDVAFRIERNGAASTSEIMGRLMYAPDGVEANAIQAGDTFAVRINDDDTIWREQFVIRLSPEVGSVLWFEIARNPGSNNSGQLGTTQPAGDLSSWNPSNTAVLTIGKFVTF